MIGEIIELFGRSLRSEVVQRLRDVVYALKAAFFEEMGLAFAVEALIILITDIWTRFLRRKIHSFTCQNL